MWLEKKHSCANLVSYYIFLHKSQVGPLQILAILLYFVSKFAFLLLKIISCLNSLSSNHHHPLSSDFVSYSIEKIEEIRGKLPHPPTTKSIRLPAFVLIQPDFTSFQCISDYQHELYVEFFLHADAKIPLPEILNQLIYCGTSIFFLSEKKSRDSYISVTFRNRNLKFLLESLPKGKSSTYGVEPTPSHLLKTLFLQQAPLLPTRSIFLSWLDKSHQYTNILYCLNNPSFLTPPFSPVAPPYTKTPSSSCLIVAVSIP